jgi:hypothetical protein
MAQDSEIERLTGDAFFGGRLRVAQRRLGYRFSIDAVLLAHFAEPRPRKGLPDLVWVDWRKTARSMMPSRPKTFRISASRTPSGGKLSITILSLAPRESATNYVSFCWFKQFR